MRLLVPQEDAPLAHGYFGPDLIGTADIWLVVFHRALARNIPRDPQLEKVASDAIFEPVRQPEIPFSSTAIRNFVSYSFIMKSLTKRPKKTAITLTFSRPLKNRFCSAGFVRANTKRNFQMAEAQWPFCKEEAKANVHRPWLFADDTAERPLRPAASQAALKESLEKGLARRWGEGAPSPSGVSDCVASASQALVGRKGPTPFKGLPRLRALPETPQRCHHFGNLFWHSL
jgi:hypothetical protein